VNFIRITVIEGLPIKHIKAKVLDGRLRERLGSLQCLLQGFRGRWWDVDELWPLLMQPGAVQASMCVGGANDLPDLQERLRGDRSVRLASTGSPAVL
jgi:hypothetical protein